MADNIEEVPQTDTQAAPETQVPPSRRTLYDKMIADKLYTKNFAAFNEQFSSPEKVSKLHAFLTQRGKYDKSAQDFNQQFFPDVAPAQSSLKKKDLSAPASTNGSATSTQPSVSSQLADNPLVKAPPTFNEQVIAVQANQEHEAAVEQKKAQTAANVNAMMADWLKAFPKKSVDQRRFEAESESQESVVKRAEAKRQLEKITNPDYTGSAMDWLKDEGKIVHDAVNTGVFHMGEGVVSAANFLAHVSPTAPQLLVGKRDTDNLDKIKDNVNAYLENLLHDTNFNTNEKTKKSLEKNPITSGVNAMAGFLPQLLSAESTAGASLFFGGVGDSDKELSDLKKSGVKLSPAVEHLMPIAMGAANYMFLHNNPLISAMPKTLRSSIVGKVSAEGLKNLAALGEDATSADVLTALAAPVMTVKEKISQLGVDAVKTYAKTSLDLGGLATADFATKAAANKVNEDNVNGGQTFHQSRESLMGQYRDILTSVAPAFAVAGAAQSVLANPGLLFHNSPYSNIITDRLREDSSPENVAAIQQDIAKIGKDKGWSNDDIVNTQGAVPVLADISSKLPKTMTPEEYKAGIDLITGRRQLQTVLDEAVSRKADLDPALQGQVGPFEDMLNAKIDQANDKLSSLVTKKPFTYFENEGQYFKKQEGGDPEPITKARYDLEGIENDYKPKSEQTNVMQVGEADKKGNPILVKEDESPNKTVPAKEVVSPEPKPVEPAKPKPADEVPVEVVKENAKPENPEAVTPIKKEDGKVETGKETEGQGRQDVLTPPEKIEGTPEGAPVFSHEEEAERHWIHNETDPEAIASRYHQSNFDIENTADYKEHAIHNHFGTSKINASDFSRYGDDNLLKGDPDFKRRWIDTANKQTPLDVEAQSLSNDHLEVTPQDVIDFIIKYRGVDDFKEKSKTALQKEMEDKYSELTGKKLTDNRAEEAFNKQIETHAQHRIDENVQDIINTEGITYENIDKMRGEFRGFPYTEEDFDHVKRYLDEQQKTRANQGGTQTASVGAGGESVGEGSPAKPASGPENTAKRGSSPTGGRATHPAELTDEQQKIAKEYNQRIGVVTDDLVKANQAVEKKLKEISERNNLFDDDTVGKNPPQQTIMGVPLNVSMDVVKTILDPLHAHIGELERELDNLQKQREVAIRTVYQQPTVFDAPTDDGQTSVAKNNIVDADKVVETRNTTPAGGEKKKNVREGLNEFDKKAFDEIRKKLKQNIRQELNETSSDSGEQFSANYNHELYSNGIALTNLYFKAGITSFGDYAQEMIADMGEDVVPYLKSFYEGAKNLPGQTASFDSTDTVDYYLAKLNEPQAPERIFIDRVKSDLMAGNKLNILSLEEIAKDAGLSTDTRVGLQEYTEQALMEVARDIIDNPLFDDRDKFNELVDLYNKQPSLNQRSTTKIILQQYSTPLPYAYSAGLYVDSLNPERVYDPTAGNGFLTIAFNPDKVRVNEIDPLRLKILSNLGFDPTNFDAVNNRPNIEFGGLISNPPFGPAADIARFGNYSFKKLENIIPLNALRQLKDNGRAAIIIGGHTEYAENGMVKGTDFTFLNYLHHNYNVTDVINVDGNLFQKQGTTFPTRLILINGRKEVPQGYTPLYDAEANKSVKTFEDLYNRIQERIKSDENPSVLQSRVDVQLNPGDTTDVRSTAELPAENTGRTGAVSGNEDNEAGRAGIEGKEPGNGRYRGQIEFSNSIDVAPGDSEGVNGERQLADVPESIAKYAEGAEAGSIGPEGSGEFVPVDRPVSANRPTGDQLVKSDKVPYIPASRLTEAGSVIPSNMAYETEQNLKEIEELYGPVDTFVANELGYPDLDTLSTAFFSEQVDAIGMAIHQLKQGKGMIIGDMTGIGKGRIAAGLIRWVSQQGEVPIFFTENADLFSDIYRDLHGIGSGHLTPFIVNDPSSDRDANVKRGGNVIYKAGTIKDKRAFFEAKKVPRGTKVILCTYSQINSEKNTLKRGFVSAMANNGYMLLDESHNVAGDSNSGKFFQDLLDQSKASAFFSATYAKRADNMPVYAIKTSMRDANMSSDALVEAIQSGGNALQEIVASQLVKSGQMIRRERDFTGVVNTFISLGVDKDGKIDEVGKKHRELADQVVEVCNAIIDFEKTYVVPALGDLEKTMRKNGQRVSQTKSKSLSVSNTPFASKMFNIVNQMLFSIKAPDLAQLAINHLKEGRKPVISFNSTMESFIKNGGYKPGDIVPDVSFSASLMNGLKNTLRYRVEYPNGDKMVDYLQLTDLPDEGVASWNVVVDLIKSASADMSISPIDNITELLENAGYGVGEITGRAMKLKFNEDHSSAVVEAIGKRDTAGIIHDFNNGGGGGRADVILLNASGATGFSMHADKSFRDQRERVMINGQMELDINKEIQKRGRIDRTNQVRRGKFDYVNSSIPAETRLSMMFSDKLKKLQANTTSDQKSKANDVATTDFLNDYGDQVMTDYLRDHPDIYEKLFQGADPAGIKDAVDGKITKVTEGIARKATGRAALLKVAEQEMFYDEVSQSYNDYIDYLNSTDQNTLAVKSVNLEAKLLSIGTFIEGKHTQSPFGQDSMLERIEANVLRKPLSKVELEEEIENSLKGKTPAEASKELINGLHEFYDETEKRMLIRFEERHAAQDEKDKKKYGTNVEMYKAAKELNDQNLDKNVESIKTDIATSMGKMESIFRDYKIGSEQMVPSSMSAGETKYTKGIFVGFKMKEKYAYNPYNPSNVLMKFAVLDGKRMITVAASRGEFINALYAGKAQLSAAELKAMGNLRDNWEETVKKTKEREIRYVVTGNILQAFRPNMGQLVSYTTDEGKINKGILLPSDFNPAKEGRMVGAVGIYQRIMALLPGESVTSSDGNVSIERNNSRFGDEYSMSVPKSTAKGGKYFKNESILDIVEHGEFESYAGFMVAPVPSYRMMDLLKVLEDDYNMRFNAGIDFRTVAEADDNEANSTETVSKPPKAGESGQSFVKGKSTERIQSEVEEIKPGGEIKKLPEMINELAKGINVKIFYAKSKRANAAGSYSPSAGGIKLSSVNNLDVAVHEVGHALDDAYLIFDTIPAAQQHTIMSELQWFADRGGSNPPGNISPAKKIEYLKREGIAEFTRAYAINKKQAEIRGPQFFAHFEDMVPEDARQVLDTFGADYNRYINSTAKDNIMANIEEVPAGERSGYRTFIKTIFGNKDAGFKLTPFDQIQIRLSNSGKAFNKSFEYMVQLGGGSPDRLLPDENAETMSKLFAGVDSKIGSFFDDGLVTGRMEPVIDGRTGRRMNTEWLYDAFDSTSEETLKQDMALSIAYMFSERTIEKAMQFDRMNDISGISAAGTQTDTDIAIKFLTKEFGHEMPREQKIRVLEGARRYQLWADKMLRYMVDKGRMSESAYREIKEKNLSYVAFLPVQENAPGIENSFDNVVSLSRSANVGNVKTVIREMTGSTMYKRHPYVSLLQNTAAMIKEADRNEVLQSYVEPMINAMRGMGEGKVNPFANIMMEVTAAEKFAGKPVMTVYLKGAEKHYMFSQDAKDVYEYIKGLSTLPQLPGVVTAIPRAIRFGVTRFPVFALRNIQRDTFSRLIISRTGSGFGSFVKDREGEKALFKLYGGDQAGYYLSNRIDYYKLQNQTIKEMVSSGKGVVLNPATLAKIGWEKYEKLLAKGEMINRMAEFRSAYNMAIKPKAEGGLGFGKYSAGVYAADQARELMNFGVGGTWMKYVNLVIPFANAQVQGLKRSMKAASENGWKGAGILALRLAMYTMVPTLLMRLLAKTGDYEEEYDNLPANQRDMFWNFKTPVTGELWITIPKPFDLGLASSGADRAMGLSAGHENAFRGYSSSLYQTFALLKPEMSAGPGAAIIEPITNYSFFKQGPIVPRYEENKILALRNKFNSASRIGKGTSVAVSPLFKDGDSIDPRYVDNLMQSVFSYYGETAMNLSDIGSKSSRQKFGLKSTGFIRDQQIYGDARVEKLYELAEDLGMTGTKPIKAMGALIGAYYDTTDPEARKQLHEQIMQSAKVIYDTWIQSDIYKEKIQSRGKEINFN